MSNEDEEKYRLRDHLYYYWYNIKEEVSFWWKDHTVWRREARAAEALQKILLPPKTTDDMSYRVVTFRREFYHISNIKRDKEPDDE